MTNDAAMRKAVIPATFALVALAASFSAHALEPQQYGKVDIDAATSQLPTNSDKVLEEARLVDNATTGVRVFRVYRPVPRHHHKFADTYLKILSGKAEVSIDGEKPFVASAGEMVFWRAGVDHEVTRIIQEPLVFLVFDSPVRRKGDVTFFQSKAPDDGPNKW